MFSFFAVPILLGDITIDFMQMIDVMVDVMVTATGEEGEGTGNNNNNNNNNGEGAEGECESTGNNNNCNNNNNRSVLLLGHIFFCDVSKSHNGDKSWSLLQRRKWIVIYFVKKLVKESQ